MTEIIKYNLKEKIVIYTISAIVGIVVIMLCMLLAAAVCLATYISDNYSTLISGICLGIGSLLCGYLSARKIKYSGILNGLFSGAIVAIIFLTISLFISSKIFTIVGLSHLLICLISSSIGGVFGVNSSKKTRIL